MTAVQAIKIYELLLSYSIDKDEAKLIISEIEEILSIDENNDFIVESNGLFSESTINQNYK